MPASVIDKANDIFGSSDAQLARRSELSTNFYARSLTTHDEHKRDAQNRHYKNGTGQG